MLCMLFEACVTVLTAYDALGPTRFGVSDASVLAKSYIGSKNWVAMPSS